ncbi:glycyl-tRNA ligase [Salinarchaeum sp. Harcht-Bsk1]|uniref:glycine--tRNA ligase n=1 Tax=Salinarchaeum sp. Harcht-Bsk1 TaxID=1333523 RepID=UPI00034229A5|nr:glycine--tRNA ligase [Salinarchaeum sp. Harcht-Bsk1]AGN01066.1 glycyl-tRNA ligase [Salinarchaeum sp. Harcht-Bsk1]
MVAPANAPADLAEEVVELAKRRGYFFQSSEAYGGVAGFYTYGPQGAGLKQNVEDAWRERYAIAEGHQEVDAPTIMPEPVFEASGHLDTFDDMLVSCAECAESHRADHLIEDAPGSTVEDAEALPIPEVEELLREYEITCPNCGEPLAGEPVEDFNLMFGTNIGPGDASPGYLRPETAQGIFVEFPRLKQYARGQLPFGVTQIGRAYRNEISPRKSIVRTREFTQAELEHFIDPELDEPDVEAVADVEVTLYSADAQQAEDGEPIETTIGSAVEDEVVESDWIAYYLGVTKRWYDRVGVDMDRFRFRQHLPGELAHYSSDCWDAEGYAAGDWIEMAGFSYRSDYDLRKHAEYADDDFTVFKQYDEPRTTKRATVDPDMSELGPTFGGAAADIAEALEAIAATDPDRFDAAAAAPAGTVEVTVGEGDDADTYDVPFEHTGYAVEEVTEAGEHLRPHVVEPSFGVDRLVYTLIEHAYREDEVDGEERAYLTLDPEVAPTTVGVFPLMDRDGMGERARDLADDLREIGLSVEYDDSGAIGRRYRRQDEVGTPFCVTVDHDTLEDGTVTIRERDSTAQVRVPADDLPRICRDLRDGVREFSALAEGQPAE